MKPKPLHPALEELAAGRAHLMTDEYAKVTNCKHQTVLKNYSKKGECFGIRPIKVGHRLLWPVDQIAALLNGETPSRVA